MKSWNVFLFLGRGGDIICVYVCVCVYMCVHVCVYVFWMCWIKSSMKNSLLDKVNHDSTLRHAGFSRSFQG